MSKSMQETIDALMPELKAEAAEAQRERRQAEKEQARVDAIRGKLPEVWTTKALADAVLPEPRYIVPGIISEGLTVLAGPPKIGKSWLVLGMVVALSVGGRVLGDIAVDRQGALYLALEDTPRRLKSRLGRMEAAPSAGAHIVTSWARGIEAIRWLEVYIVDHPEIKVVIIDTLQKVRTIEDANDYGETYREAAELKAFADSTGVPVVVLHHTRKMGAEDFLHTVAGSVGLTGAADTIITLTRPRGQADGVLSITGRDVEERELALRFDRDVMSWVILGEAGEIQRTKERQAIVDLLREAGQPMTPAQIAKELGKTANNLSHLCRTLVDDGQLTREGYGKYAIRVPSIPTVPTSPTVPTIPTFDLYDDETGEEIEE